jgi:hypothetical protein
MTLLGCSRVLWAPENQISCRVVDVPAEAGACWVVIGQKWLHRHTAYRLWLPFQRVGKHSWPEWVLPRLDELVTGSYCPR